MSDSPAPPQPPSPTTTPVPSAEPSKDNPIAIAGILVSVLGLVLAIIVVGFFIGIVGFALSAVGYRRSKTGLDGRRLSIGGMLLGLLAMAFSVLSLVILVRTINSGDSFLFGDTDSSLAEQFPPEDDVDSVECRASNSGRIGQAVVTLTNNANRGAAYDVDIAWLDDDGTPVTASVRSDFTDPGETIDVRVIDLTGTGIPDSCDLLKIDRTVNPFGG